MKKIIPYIIILTLISCNTQIEKEDLFGTWYLYRNNNFSAIRIAKDSIFTNYILFSESGKYNLKNNVLHFKDSNNNSTNQFEIRIDSGNQIMTVETEKAWLYGESQRKAKNFIQYFEALKGIELKTLDSLETSKIDWERGFNLYITNKSGYPKISTDLSNGIENWKRDFTEFKDKQAQEIQDKLVLFLFVDKEIDSNYLNEIIGPLKMDFSNPIFMVSRTDISDYQMEGIYWNIQRVE